MIEKIKDSDIEAAARIADVDAALAPHEDCGNCNR